MFRADFVYYVTPASSSAGEAVFFKFVVFICGMFGNSRP